jgi:hypothetical protein
MGTRCRRRPSSRAPAFRVVLPQARSVRSSLRSTSRTGCRGVRAATRRGCLRTAGQSIPPGAPGGGVIADAVVGPARQPATLSSKQQARRLFQKAAGRGWERCVVAVEGHRGALHQVARHVEVVSHLLGPDCRRRATAARVCRKRRNGPAVGRLLHRLDQRHHGVEQSSPTTAATTVGHSSRKASTGSGPGPACPARVGAVEVGVDAGGAEAASASSRHRSKTSCTGGKAAVQRARQAACTSRGWAKLQAALRLVERRWAVKFSRVSHMADSCPRPQPAPRRSCVERVADVGVVGDRPHHGHAAGIGGATPWRIRCAA